MTPFKINKLTSIPAVIDRDYSCLYVIKPPGQNSADLYITGSNNLDLVHISSLELITKTGIASNPLAIGIGYKDNVTEITTGVSVAYVRSPRSFLCTTIRASVHIPSNSGAIKIDIKKNGVSILPLQYNSGTSSWETKYLQIDETEETSVSSTVQFPGLFVSIADDDKVTIDVVAAGTGATGLIVTLIEGSV